MTRFIGAILPSDSEFPYRTISDYGSQSRHSYMNHAITDKIVHIEPRFCDHHSQRPNPSFFLGLFVNRTKTR